MVWAEVLNDKSLQDLPYKIELNRFGNIVMSPATNWHGNFQVTIGYLLIKLTGSGKVMTECSIMTSDNVKVADVAWVSDEFLAKYQMRTPYPMAPEICVEVKSPSNTMEGMATRRRLYFEKGAKEVWFCNKVGTMQFFNAEGEIKKSALVKKFPKRIS